MTSSVAGLWTEVEASLAAEGMAASSIRLKATGLSTSLGPVLAGLDASGHRCLCIPAPQEELGRKDVESKGVSLEVRPLIQAGAEKPFLTVVCHLPDLNALFTVVAEEMLRELEVSPRKPFNTCAVVIQRWRALLERPRVGRLSTEALAALLAELLLLEQLASRSSEAVHWWLGPKSSVHDFVCGRVDFEVKSSLRTSGRLLEVSDLAQLEVSDGSELYVVFRRLRHSPGRGDSVPASIERLRTLGCDSAVLFDRLGAAGYDPAHADAYGQVTFETIEEVAYHVDASFPRLTGASFVPGGRPPQVVKVRYTLSLDGPAPRALGAAEFKAVVDAAVGNGECA